MKTFTVYREEKAADLPLRAPEFAIKRVSAENVY
jgi:hypothetical protein